MGYAKGDCMTQKFAVKISDNAHIYIHNDLANAADYLKRKIEERSRNNDRDGIGLEIMACLIMIAFAFEAQINFLGFKVDKNWEERKPYLYKLERVARKLNVQDDFTTRPYSTIKILKEFRDMLAHGKPTEIQGEKNLVLTREELERRNILRAAWEDYLNEEFLRRSYDDTESIWRSLLEASGLNILDTITSGGSTVQIIESVDR